jgi:hypothetical protein
MLVCVRGGEFVRTADYLTVEQRALDAEREREELRVQLTVVTAERDALVPLARLGLGGLDGGSYYLSTLVGFKVSKPSGEETPATTRARAILEGK